MNRPELDKSHYSGITAMITGKLEDYIKKINVNGHHFQM
jgi:hypothetical protein